MQSTKLTKNDKNILLGGFVPHKKPTVWQNVDESSLLNIEQVEIVQQYWYDAWEKLDFDPVEEYQAIKDRQLNRQAEPSVYWAYWAASNQNVSINCRQDLSANLREQRKRILSTEVPVTGPRALPAALMCCDTPGQTGAFIYRVFCDQHNISFGERIEKKPLFEKYFAMMFAIGFIGKKTLSISRPSDFEKNVLGIRDNAESVSKIPHPNHGSYPGGHPICGYAAVRGCEWVFQKRGVPQWRKLGYEAGWARVDLGIHWAFDITGAFEAVDHFHEMVTEAI